jgi:L-rhamnose mutarotase
MGISIFDKMAKDFCTFVKKYLIILCNDETVTKYEDFKHRIYSNLNLELFPHLATKTQIFLQQICFLFKAFTRTTTTSVQLHSVNATVLHTPWQMFAFQIHLT